MTKLILLLALLAAASLAAIWLFLHEMSNPDSMNDAPLKPCEGDFGEAGW